MSPCSAAAAWPSPFSSLRQRLGVALGGDEDDALRDVDVGEQMIEHPMLVRMVVGEMHALLDRERRGLLATAMSMRTDRAVRRAARRAIAPSNVAENSTVWRVFGRARDALDVVDEAHVEHAVGFVEHQHLERATGRCGRARDGR